MQARNLLSYNTDLLSEMYDYILSLYCLIMVKHNRACMWFKKEKKWADSDQQLIHMNVSIINIFIVWQKLLLVTE